MAQANKTPTPSSLDDMMMSDLLLEDDVMLTTADFEQALAEQPPPPPPARVVRGKQLSKGKTAITAAAAAGNKSERRKQQVARAVKNYRHRRKEELEYLRNKVSDLQQQLDALQPNPKTLDTAANILGKRPSEDHLAVVSPSQNWERLAQNEHKKRRQAEEENKILRREIKSQMYFAQTLQQFFIDSKESQFFPNVFTMGDNSLKLSTNMAMRRQMILDACASDLRATHDRLNAAGLAIEHLHELPLTKTTTREIGGTRQIEVSRALMYVGFSAEQVAKAVTKIFWAEVDLPSTPAGGPVEFEELDPVNAETSYSRFVCNMGTASCKLPSMEKLVIRRRHMVFGETPTITWRTVIDDPLCPSTGKHPRIDESGCLTVENEVFKGQRGAMIRMVVHIRPPFDAMNFPVGTVVESYMSGFVDYMSQIEQLLGFMLIASSIF